MTEKKENIGPEKISFTTFLLKILATGAGGFAGSLILFIIFLFTGSVFPSAGDEFISPIFVFILLIMIFLASTVSNIISVWLLALTEKGKYKRISSAIYQVFIVSIIILVLMVPVYLISVNSNIAFTGYVVALHIIIAAQVSALILEIISNYRYALLGVYGVSFAVLVSAAILFSLSGSLESPQLLLFLALPVIWVSIAIVHTLVVIIYGWIARTYDKDFLSTQTVYGDDYGKEVETPKESPKAKDESGGDFLRHN